MKNLSIAAGHDLEPRSSFMEAASVYKGPIGDWHEIEEIDGIRKCKHCYAHETWGVMERSCTIGQIAYRNKKRRRTK